MLQNGRKSIFLAYAERLCDRIGVADLPRRARAWYGRADGRLKKGIFGALVSGEYDRMGWQYRLRRRGMQMRERSAIVRLRNRAGRYLLDSSLGYVGLWLLISGLSLLILSLILGRGSAREGEIEACALLILLAMPLLGSTRSLGQRVPESRLLGRFLFGFCGRCPDELGELERGRARPLGVLVAAMVTTLLGGLLSVRTLFAFLILFPVLLLLLSIPELALLAFLGAFPLCFLSEHPTGMICLLALVVHLSFLSKIYCGRRDFSLETVDLFVLLFCLLLLLGGLFGYGELSDGIVLSLLASLYFPAVHLLSSARWRRRAVVLLLAGALLSPLLGIYQYFFTDLPALWLDTERFSDLGGRVTGVFGNPNVLGIYLLLIFPMSASLVLSAKERVWARVLSALVSLSILFCAVLTWSRGAWLAILAELFLILLFSGTRSAALCLLSPIGVLAVIPFLPSNVLHRFLSIGSLADSSIRYRIYTWRGVLRMIGEHPFGIGVGETAFRRVYPQYAVSGIETVMHAHQVPLQLAAELGIVGVVTLGTAFLFLIARGIGRAESYGCAYALCGAIVMGVFDHLWYAKGMIAFVFIVAAFAAGGRERV